MGKIVKSNKTINGTFGKVWVNNELYGEVQSAEAKVTLEFEEKTFAGDLAVHYKLISWSGEGTMTLDKVFSRGLALLKDIPKTGIVPDITINFALSDPDAYGVERCSISEVVFKEFMLAQFEMKKTGTLELPFNFSDFDIIDLIAASATAA